MNIGKKIAEIRIKQNMSQEELADRLFVSRNTISKWETGRFRPDQERIKEMCRIFSVDVGYFESSNDFLERELSKCIPAGVDIAGIELSKVLSSFLRTLPERDRNVFISRYHFMEEPEQIGDKYDMNTAYIYVILSRTRSKLKKYLSQRESAIPDEINT